jgi:hypothetical protein
MASFYAELQVAGATYPVRHCTYEFTQATSERGRVTAKVRHSLVQLLLDVPTDDKLLDWAHMPGKPLAGRVSFYDAKGGPVLETLTWEEGQCVGYQEEFVSGSITEGAYVCHLTIAAPKLTLQPGGPLAYVAPAPGQHGSPPSAAATVLAATKLKAEEVATGVIKKVLTPAGEVGTELFGVGLAAITRTASLTLGLLLTPTNSRDDPGYASEWELYRRNQQGLSPLNPAQLRLAQLERLREQGDLTAAEETELITLLGQVKGIHVRSLADLPTFASRLPDAAARPTGSVTRINPLDEAENQLALRRENESAVILAQAGYKVEQNPTVAGTTRNPDYLIENRVFDCYAPTNSKPRSIASTLEGKIKKGQAQRFILNLEDSHVDIQALQQQFTQYPVAGLQEVIVIKHQQVIPFIP